MVGLLPVNMRARLLPKRDRLVIRALRLSHHEDEDADQEQGGQDEAQRAEPAAPLAGGPRVERRPFAGRDASFIHEVDDRHPVGARTPALSG